MSAQSVTLYTTVGDMTIRPVHPDRDTATLHGWLTHPRSRFWGALDTSADDIRHEYTRIHTSTTEDAWLIHLDASPVALVETYDPVGSPLAPHLELREGDVGMHVLVAAPGGEPVHGLTDAVFAALMRWLTDVRGARRVVVEPDAANTPVLTKNALAGFHDAPGSGCPDLGHKTARIQICEAGAFHSSELAGLAALSEGPSSPTHLTSAGTVAERQLVAKAIREFVHERLLTASPTEEPTSGRWRWYRVFFGGRGIRFRALGHELEHLSIDPDSLSPDDGRALRLVELVSDAAPRLGVPPDFLHTYLEELQATLAARARILAAPRPDAARLAGPDAASLSDPHRQARHLQFIEAAMTEGHPGFLANAGRGGMSERDLAAWAPELGRSTRLVWLAARRSMCVHSVADSIRAADFLPAQMGPRLWRRFREQLLDRGLDPHEYLPLPVHPWQWENRVTTTFATNLVAGDLVYLGPGEDLHRPQQSLRTFFNVSRPEAAYIKTAVAVRNMGFLRGLSPAYMDHTPAINDWLQTTLGEDEDLRSRNVRLLREVATVGFTGDVYHRSVRDGHAGDGGHLKMLSALWRESPVPMLGPGTVPATLAAVLHIDAAGRPLVGEWIERSGVGARSWVDALLAVYLRPVLRALIGYDIVFMPHGENIILELRNGLPVGSFFKDLGEEVAVVNHVRRLPPGLERIMADHGDIDDAQRALSVHTDVIDGVLRHLAALLDDHGFLPEREFWLACRECVEEYDADHPGTAGRLPLLSGTFRHSCLNRLQLRNPTSMVNLGDQNSSLLYAGEMPNPLAVAPVRAAF
ncbi:GNAT family N-acetyltransferase [Corynebacterium halotolerans]|uniref:Lysine N-acyltransferase MbtK n=1 Tax=Corynebacterium halotolerans YIM 70093 = DSM 44683 TaxID=1121362 RepID=M1NPV7_9CORY|nr:GNAT family N-acetyltransferase [Corynebacterium halotolerans]AGF71517.1 IucA/IucC family protein [Corynebacterium halotolerans YIM 70093 = DSM 44683]